MSRKYKPQTFESTGKYTDANGTPRNDTSANIYMSMMTSKAWQELTNRQRLLYIACKSRQFGHRKPNNDYPEVDKIDERSFYMPIHEAVYLGIYTKNMRGEFYGDIKALISYGFIKLIFKGGGGYRKAVYRYSDEWRLYGQS